MINKIIKNISTLLFIVAFFLTVNSLSISAQKVKPTPKPSTNLKPKATPKPKKTPVVLDEKKEFETAKAITYAPERINMLRGFKAKFPNSELQNRASELIVSAYAELAENSLKANELIEGNNFFKLAVKEIPALVSDELFVNIILQFPTNLFYRGQQAEAVELANLIEEKIGGTPKYLLGLATFYLGIENGEKAKNLAEKAITLDSNSFAAYQTLGIASRINFDLQNAEVAYTKALELDSESIVSKRSLAEIKRSVGKPLESETLYREILDKNPDDVISQTGLIIALFDAGKKVEAEAIIDNPNAKFQKNLQFLVSVAYWYAANNNSERALEYAKQAVELEPRYVWAQIALSRALLLQNKPLEAERAMLAAKQYGNFPTLSYELAATRFQAGLYEEAVTELKTNFSVNENLIETKLGGRIPQKAATFIDLLSAERRASIFQPMAADNLETSEKLKYLLDFNLKLNSPTPSETELSKLADDFTAGNDKNQAFRQLYIASRLLEKKIAYEKVLKLTQLATNNVDTSLGSPFASSAILADELIQSRASAISRGITVVIPEIPRLTLSNIMRCRIEEITGWTFYQQGKYVEAITRLKRASGIAPEKSAWWRSSTWRLGAAFDANLNQKEALENYVKVYKSSEPTFARRAIIEILYQKMNGNLDGLDEKLGDKRQVETVAKNIPNPTPEVTPTPISTPEPTPTPTPELAKSETSNLPENSGESRPRVVITSDLPPPQCSIVLSQESVSLISGRQIGVLIVIQGEGKIDQLSVTSSSPLDISASLETDFVKGSNRGFFTFKSISEKTGEFKITFELPCGKKEVLVKVR